MNKKYIYLIVIWIVFCLVALGFLVLSKSTKISRIGGWKQDYFLKDYNDFIDSLSYNYVKNVDKINSFKHINDDISIGFSWDSKILNWYLNFNIKNLNSIYDGKILTWLSLVKINSDIDYITLSNTEKYYISWFAEIDFLNWWLYTYINNFILRSKNSRIELLWLFFKKFNNKWVLFWTWQFFNFFLDYKDLKSRTIYDLNKKIILWLKKYPIFNFKNYKKEWWNDVYDISINNLNIKKIIDYVNSDIKLNKFDFDNISKYLSWTDFKWNFKKIWNGYILDVEKLNKWRLMINWSLMKTSDNIDWEFFVKDIENPKDEMIIKLSNNLSWFNVVFSLYYDYKKIWILDIMIDLKTLDNYVENTIKVYFDMELWKILFDIVDKKSDIDDETMNKLEKLKIPTKYEKLSDK